jgi:hypothetical protein
MGSFGKNTFQSKLLPAFKFLGETCFQRTFNPVLVNDEVVYITS